VSAPLAAERDCTWSIQPNANGVTAEPTTGQGDATLTITVGPNPLGRVRPLVLRINNQEITIPQHPTPCSYAVAPRVLDVPAEGGRVRLQVTTLEGCLWTAGPADSWVRLVSESGGDRSQWIELAVHSNVGEQRTSEVRIAELAVTIRQRPASDSARGCPYSMARGSANFPATGGEGQVRLHTRPTCAWGTTVDQPWVMIVSNTDASGTGDIRYLVEPNPSARARVAIITAGGRRHVVRQAGSL
jgi:hypothetical protein